MAHEGIIYISGGLAGGAHQIAAVMEVLVSDYTIQIEQSSNELISETGHDHTVRDVQRHDRGHGIIKTTPASAPSVGRIYHVKLRDARQVVSASICKRFTYEGRR
jgi:hypothetical protein